MLARSMAIQALASYRAARLRASESSQASMAHSAVRSRRGSHSASAKARPNVSPSASRPLESRVMSLIEVARPSIGGLSHS
ncbi:hypothetical protein D3C87_1695650 [compost metagenome]